MSAFVTIVVILTAATLARGPLQRRSRRVAEARVAVDALPLALDLCAVTLGAGGTIADAVAALAAGGPRPVREVAARARERTGAGEHLDEALRWLQDELGPSFQSLAGTLVRAQEQGGPVAVTLARLAGEASMARRRQGELRARRLPVLLLVPLVTCALPAVLVGAVLPLALVGLRQLSL